MSSKRLPPALLALTPGDLLPAHLPGFLARTAQALAAGLRGVLLREQRLSDRDALQLARELRAQLDGVGGWLGMHDRLHLAPACAADGVHLGFRSLGVGESRALLGHGRVIGRSTHAHEPVETWRGADYRFYGPLRSVPGKHPSVEPVGVQGVAAALGADATPLWVLGGVRPEDLRDLLASGVHGVALLSGVLGAPDPGAAMRAFLSAWPAGTGGGRGGAEDGNSGGPA